MIVTELKDSTFVKSKIKVYIDDEYMFSLYKSDIKKLGLKVGGEISGERISHIYEKILSKNALDDAYRYLMRGDYTRKSLYEKLVRREIPEEIVESALEKIVEKGYVNDYEYAKKYIKDAMLKNKGKRYIEFELYKKGIEKDIISYILEDEDMGDKAYEIAEKKVLTILKGKDKPEIKDLRKVNDYLLRQGFSFDEVSGAIERIKEMYE